MSTRMNKDTKKEEETAPRGFFRKYGDKTFRCPESYKVFLIRHVLKDKIRSLAKSKDWYSKDEDTGQFMCQLCPAAAVEPMTMTNLTNHLANDHEKIFAVMKPKSARRLRKALQDKDEIPTSEIPTRSSAKVSLKDRKKSLIWVHFSLLFQCGFDPDLSRPFEDIAKLAACVNNDSTREILAENLKARLRDTQVRDSKHLASIVVLSLVGRKIRLTHRWDSSRKG